MSIDDFDFFILLFQEDNIIETSLLIDIDAVLRFFSCFRLVVLEKESLSFINFCNLE